MEPPPVRYVKTSDGMSIAYAASGSGRPLVLMPTLFSHLQIYWTQPTFVLPWLTGLAARFRLVQYDGRGQGMSSRDLAGALSMADLALDIEAVIDHLALDSFVLLGAQWYGHVAVRYAIQHPDRVSALILASSSVSNLAWPMTIYEALAAQDWDAFLRTSAAIGQAPDVSASIQRLKQTTNQKDWLVIVRAGAQSDLTELLPKLQTPTLVLHPREFLNLPAERSMELAARIPNARVVLIDGSGRPRRCGGHSGDRELPGGPYARDGRTYAAAEWSFIPRGRGPAPHRRGQEQSSDRGRVGDQPQHRPTPREQHPGEDRPREPDGSGCLRAPSQPRLTA